MLKISKKAITFGLVSFFLVFLVIRGLKLPNFRQQVTTPSEKEVAKVKEATTVAANLEIPWALAFLPDGRFLVTERPGRVRLVDRDDPGSSTLVAEISEVKHFGEGGLLGLALHPDFENNHGVYLYYTYSNVGENTFNRVVRYQFENDRLRSETIVVDAIPGAANHNGGRIKFGPDGFLYVTTGDAQNPSLAQDKNSLAGKILRLTDEGQPAPGNPFGNLVYSWGHRNSQGLAWDEQGRLWATEHGRSGVLSGFDEINLIKAGKNYGWPVIQGDEKRSGMEGPRLHSGSDTWAPAGAVFVGDSLFFGGLRGQSLYGVVFGDGRAMLTERRRNEFGRIREVALRPDGFLYIATSNRDGRGEPQEGDDRIIKIDSQSL